jgi:hypothetical protein
MDGLTNSEKAILNVVLEVSQEYDMAFDAAAERIGIDKDYAFRLFLKAHGLQRP